jgi:hypothetical protein
MTNRIVDAMVLSHRLDIVETELRVLVTLDRIDADTLVRGRLTGPRSALASTVEVAYPLREIARLESNQILFRVVIPEASFWEPETPLLYQGPLELWQDGERCDLWELSHGLRRLQLTPAGCRMNGRLQTIRGVARSSLDANEVPTFRANGINLVVLDASRFPDAAPLADRWGMLLLYRVERPSDYLRWRDIANRQPSTFGWLFGESMLDEEFLAQKLAAPASLPLPTFLGAEKPGGDALPPSIAFTLGAAPTAGKPCVQYVEALPALDAARPAGVLGWVQA